MDEPRAPIAPTFAGQLRVAADDPNTTAGTMREAMRNAASLIEGYSAVITAQQYWIDRLRLQVGAGFAVGVSALALGLVFWLR